MGKRIVCFMAGMIWISAGSLLAATTAASAVPAKTPAAIPMKPKAKAPVKAKAKIPVPTPTATMTPTVTETPTETWTPTLEFTPTATPTFTPAVPVSLPKEGSIAWNVGVAGWQASFQDIQDIYGGGMSDPSPFGGEFDLGADLTLAPCFQLGLQAQGIMRAPEELHLYDEQYTDTWNVNVVGGALVMKYLFPLQDRVNLIVHGEGGYYSLVASSIVGGGAASGTVNLDAANFGGMGCLEAEMLLDSNNAVALDIGLGYRYLKMTPVSLSGTYCNIAKFGSLQNAGGADSLLDLSGLRMNATLRFY